MIHSEEWVGDRVKLYTKSWIPSGQVKATVVFLHGFGEHVNRYNHVFDAFATAGIKVRAFDQRGFGQTGRKGGILGHHEGQKVLFNGAFKMIIGTSHLIYRYIKPDKILHSSQTQSECQTSLISSWATLWVRVE